MSRLTKKEQETVINFNVAETEAVVFTRDRAVMRKQYVSYRKPRRISAARRKQIQQQMQDINNAK